MSKLNTTLFGIIAIFFGGIVPGILLLITKGNIDKAKSKWIPQPTPHLLLKYVELIVGQRTQLIQNIVKHVAKSLRNDSKWPVNVESKLKNYAIQKRLTVSIKFK